MRTKKTTQKDLNLFEEMEREERILTEAFCTESVSDDEKERRKAKAAIDKSIARHNAKTDKFYKRYLHRLYNDGRYIYYYPFKGLTKEEVEKEVAQLPFYKN
ncbi:hypothetical protein ACHJH3_06830 [Campylobacter sp. MOP7]|uniref:hypothetical protein n=1 Tax=Campylobacter canis TaxID=3378588 RepID=UPI00387EAA52